MHISNQNWMVAAATFVATLLATLIVLNLSLGNKQIDESLQHVYSVEDAQFPQAIGAILTPPLTDGNRVQALINGDEIFPAILAAIRSAQRTVTLETYIYWSGSIGHEVSEALVERARAGVRVHVLLDWIGSELDDELLERMQSNGIEVQRYNPPVWYRLGRMNHRTHRRLLVVDGRIGFIGGAGFGDKWRGDAQDAQHWRDTHFRVEGPVVTQLQSAFIDNWIQTTGRLLHGIEYLPDLKPRGTAAAHVFSSSPGGGAKSVQLMYLLSIASSTRTIDLSAAYFVPDEVALRSLVTAARRGVRVRIIMPGPHMDKALVRRASRADWGALLAAGAELYEYQPTMFHCKVMVVDALWTSVGSTNFDSRSFTINDEANLNVYDAAFARDQIDVFEADLSQSRRITREQWDARPWWDRTLDAAASLLSSQL